MYRYRSPASQSVAPIERERERERDVDSYLERESGNDGEITDRLTDKQLLFIQSPATYTFTYASTSISASLPVNLDLDLNPYLDLHI